jgi:hypothetical protein
MAITTTLTSAPDLPDRTEQDQSTFDTRMSAWWAYMKDDFEPELNAITDEINSTATTVNGYKTDAESAQTAAETAESNAEDWATTTDALVDSTDYSAKEWAQGTTANSAKQWATKIGSTVDATDYSARHYANEAEAARDAAIGYNNASEYAAGTTYSAGDVVLDPGDSYRPYISQQDSNTGNTPNTDDGTWWVEGIQQPGLELLSSAEASDDATIEFTGITSDYDEYEVRLLNVIPATDGVRLAMTTSSDGGSNWDTGSNDYRWAVIVSDSANDADQHDPSILITGTSYLAGSHNYENGVSVRVSIVSPADATDTTVYWAGMFFSQSWYEGTVQGFGQRKERAAVNAIRFAFSDGNIESGKIKLYGVRK